MTTPNGTIDLDPFQTAIRNYIFKISQKCFETYGSVRIDTPVLEMYSTVKNLYGGDFNKQVFMINQDEQHNQNEKNTTNESQHDTRMLLRYDLTVPLCRYVSSLNLRQFRRHQIGKVYRKDHAQITKGRFREFYQMDFDIVGHSEENIYDIEMIDALTNVLDKLVGLNNVTIKINHKGIINALLNYVNIEDQHIKQTCSILDRLDKVDFSAISGELSELIGSHKVNILESIYNTKLKLCELKSIFNIDEKTYENMKQIFDFVSHLDSVVFDPFLIRGMDYYTGILFEVGYNDKELMPFTISAGGRYDNMIESFGSPHTPAIGMSLGIERIAKIIESLEIAKQWKLKPVVYDVYLATIAKTNDKNITSEQMKICSELRKSGLRVLTTHIKEQKFKRHFDNVFNAGIKYMIILGDKEIEENTISIKNIETKEQITIKRSELVEYLKHR